VTNAAKTKPTLDLNFLSHGTPVASPFGSGSAVTGPMFAQSTFLKSAMSFLNHNGIDVHSEAEVDKCCELARRVA
jgi:hypothetical protein